MGNLLLLALGVTCVASTLPLLRAYMLNTEYVSFTPIQAAGLVAVCSLIVFAIVAGSLAATRGRVRKLLMLFWCVVLVFTWMVANFFVWDFGFFDGRRLDLGEMPVPLATEAAALVVIVFGVWFFKRRVMRHVGLLAIGLSAWSAVALVPVALDYVRTAEVLDTSRQHGFDQKDERIVQFSKSSNIILFILDTAQSNVSRRILKARPDLAARFSGFTFYQNAVSAFSKTYLSLPAILTADPYRNDEPIPAYLDEAYFSSGSIPHKLHAAGYDTRAHVEFATPQVPDPALWDNLKDQKDPVGDVAKVLRVALFNAAPLPVKAALSDDIGYDKIVRRMRNVIEGSGDEMAECRLAKLPLEGKVEDVGDTLFFKELLGCSQATIEKPVFRLFHLQGMHIAYYIGSLDRVVPEPDGEEGYYRQTEGVLRLMASAMERLKRIGVYENATIVIAGDHGAHEYGIDLDPADYGADDAPKPGQGNSPPEKVIAAGLSLMMLKPAGAGGDPVRFSDAPISTLDISPTLLEAADLEHDGSIITGISPDAPRERVHNHYAFEGWSVRYVDDLYRYTVDGPAWRPDSWSKEGTLIAPKAVAGGGNGIDVLLFEAGNRDGFDIESSTAPEKEGYPLGDLRIGLGGKEFPSAYAKVSARFKDGEDADLIETVVDGGFPASWLVTPEGGANKKERIFRLDGSTIGTISLHRQTDGAAKPPILRTLAIEPTTPLPYRIGNRLSFSDNGPVTEAASFGWSGREGWGRWSDNREAGVLLDLQQVPRGDLTLSLDARAHVAHGSDAQTIAVSANGRKVAEWIYRKGWVKEPVADIPHDAIAADGTLLLVFHIDEPAAPAWDGESKDRRLIGLGLRSLRLGDAED